MALPPQQNDTIYSDCRSITEVINGVTPKLSKFPAKLPFLQAVLHHLNALKAQGVSLQWTKAHPETRLTPDKYTDQDWGIYLADCAASGHPTLSKSTFTTTSTSPYRKSLAKQQTHKHGSPASTMGNPACPPQSFSGETQTPSTTWLANDTSAASP